MTGDIPPRPTDGELAILRVLWQRGPSTVRQAHEALAADRDTGYSTTLKMMQVMREKGLLKADMPYKDIVDAAFLPADVFGGWRLEELIKHVTRVPGGSSVMLPEIGKP